MEYHPPDVGAAGEVEALTSTDDVPMTPAPGAAAVAAVLAIPFSFTGALTPGLLSLRFPLIGQWTFQEVSIACVDNPTQTDVVLDVLYDASSIYGSLAARPRVLAGDRVGTSVSPPAVSDFQGTPSNPGVLACTIAEVGSGDPGGDLTLVLYVTSV